MSICYLTLVFRDRLQEEVAEAKDRTNSVQDKRTVDNSKEF